MLDSLLREALVGVPEKQQATHGFEACTLKKALSAFGMQLLNRLLDGGPKGFEEGISTAQYQAVAKVSKATAARHLPWYANQWYARKGFEIGDDYAITLSPSESRALGELTAGAGQQLAAIELGHQAAIMASMLNQRMLKLERLASPLENSLALVARIKALEAEVKCLSARRTFKENSKCIETTLTGV